MPGSYTHDLGNLRQKLVNQPYFGKFYTFNLLKPQSFGYFVFSMVTMRKLYVAGLLLFTLALNGYISDSTDYARMDEQPKLTHYYPNPATSYINFTFDKSIDKTYTLQVYNFMGRKMMDYRIVENRMQITLDDNYFRGLYVYQLRDRDGRIIESGKFQVVK